MTDTQTDTRSAELTLILKATLPRSRDLHQWTLRIWAAETDGCLGHRVYPVTCRHHRRPLRRPDRQAHVPGRIVVDEPGTPDDAARWLETAMDEALAARLTGVEGLTEISVRQA